MACVFLASEGSQSIAAFLTSITTSSVKHERLFLARARRRLKSGIYSLDNVSDSKREETEKNGNVKVIGVLEVSN